MNSLIYYIQMPFPTNFKTHEDYLNWYRDYRNKHREKIREYNRIYNQMWRKENGYHNETNSKYRYPEKEAARKILQYAVRRGEVIRKNCEVCGSKYSQGHHDNYTKPLEVKWFCSLHHTEYHKNTANNKTIIVS